MKIKLAVVFGIFSWAILFIISILCDSINIITSQYHNLFIPLAIMIVSTFFGILYIRNFNSHELYEGFMCGIIFIVVDLLLDLVFIILPGNYGSFIFHEYRLHLYSTIILIPLITTFLGYLAEMPVRLE